MSVSGAGPLRAVSSCGLLYDDDHKVSVRREAAGGAGKAGRHFKRLPISMSTGTSEVVPLVSHNKMHQTQTQERRVGVVRPGRLVERCCVKESEMCPASTSATQTKTEHAPEHRQPAPLH